MLIEKRKYLRIIFIWIILFYSIIAAYYFLNKPAGIGDEGLFISDLELLKKEGWIEAIKKNISIPYMLLVYPLSFFVKNYIALRLVNIILLGLLFLYFYKMSNKNSLNFYVYAMFYFSTIGFFYLGINDILFAVCLIIFLNEISKMVNNKKANISLMLTALVIAFFTRQLFFVYLPVIILGLYIFFRSKIKFNTRDIILPCLVAIFFLIFNIPSLVEKRTLSFDKKSMAKEEGVTWTQRQYLAQIMVNNGELKAGHHPSWEQTKQYIHLNGEKSLPDGILKSMTHNYQLTIKEFFKDLVFSFYFGIRQLGLMLPLSILFFAIQVYKTRKIELKYFIPISTLVMLMVFSLIIISYVELRWLIPVFILTIVFYDDLENKNSLPKRMQQLNYLVLIFLAIYGIVKLLSKIYV